MVGDGSVMIGNDRFRTVALDSGWWLRMLPRLLLVIGSQCDILNKLDFLPEVAERLHALLRHPGPGGCGGIPLEGCLPGLLLNPTVDAAENAIEAAIQEAASAGATLILAYIGHGEFPDEMLGDFYLMPKNATAPTAKRAIDFTVHIKDCLKGLKNRGSLVVLLDTCHAGAGAWQAMKAWAQSLRGNIDFELLTATDERATANAPLTRAVIELLERGDPEAPERIRCQDVHRLLMDRNHPAQHVAFNPDDARLSLGRNIAHDPGDVFWKDSPGCVEILRHTWYFQPTPQLAELVEASRSHPVVVLTGEAGAGKTSLAAALARPEITGNRSGRIVPDGFVHAVVILTDSTNQRSLADDLEKQLRRSVPGFAEAVAELERSVPLPQREALDFLPRKVLRPLDYLLGQPEVRIVLDGFDQLSDFTREAVGRALASRPGHLRLVITARPQTPGCPPGHAFDHGTTPRDDLDRYLASRRVPEATRPAILDRASGHWLVASLLAQAVLNDPLTDLAQLPGTVNDAYTKLLDQAGAADAWNETFRPVLGPLAVAGTGPVLPLPLLVHASRSLGGPESVEDIRAILTRLRGLVVRRDAGETTEHVGLFHTTLAEYLLGRSAAEVGYGIDDESVHRAMVRAINAMAPMEKHNRDDPLHRYAFLREADHLWALGDMERFLACLRSRDAYSPRENLERSRQWVLRVRERFDEDNPTILNLRALIAFWTGVVGDARERCGCFASCCRIRSACWAATTPTRSPPVPASLAGPASRAMRPRRCGWTASCCRIKSESWAATTPTRSPPVPASLAGPASRAMRGALRLLRELLPDRERVLGRDHPSTFATRARIADWTAAVGDAPEALRLLRELLPDQERVLGRDHPDTLATRGNIAVWTGELGNAPEALQLDRELLPDQERVLGRDQPDTLTTRNNIAVWTGELGNAPRRCGCSPSYCRIGSGCWAATTRTPSPPATTSLARPAIRVMRRGAAAGPRAAAGSGAGAGPRPPGHPQYPSQHRALDRRVGRRGRCMEAVHRAAAGPGAGAGP